MIDICPYLDTIVFPRFFLSSLILCMFADISECPKFTYMDIMLEAASVFFYHPTDKLGSISITNRIVILSDLLTNVANRCKLHAYQSYCKCFMVHNCIHRMK